MRLGLIVRAENRGLGIQTWEAYRHLRPWRTVCVDPGALGHGITQHFDRYPDAVVSPWDGHRLSDDALDWLADCDVVFSCETLYDWRLATLRTATVVQVNPEFYKHALDSTVPHPTMWWAPTPWRFNVLPEGKRRLVPVPVALDRFPCRVATFDNGPPRLLHVVGKVALGDRNGTNALLTALRTLRVPARVHIVTQADHLSMPRAIPRDVELSVRMGGIEDYWSLYEGHDVLVMPRRYGGLCLPVQEAMGAGLGVAMTDATPNQWWPVHLIGARDGTRLRTPGGTIVTRDPQPSAIVDTLTTLSTNRERVAEMQGWARRWAEAHSWEALRPVYEAEFERVL